MHKSKIKIENVCAAYFWGGIIVAEVMDFHYLPLQLTKN